MIYLRMVQILIGHILKGAVCLLNGYFAILDGSKQFEYLFIHHLRVPSSTINAC